MRFRTVLTVVATCLSVVAGVGVSIAPGVAQADAIVPSSVLTQGQSLGVGQQLVSPSGRYRLVVQSDGNLVNYGPYGVVWASGSRGVDSILTMQADGNLVLYAAGNVPVFQTATGGIWDPARGFTLALQDDGNLVLYWGGGYSVWASGGVAPGFLRTGWVIGTGARLESPNGVYFATAQADGNLVVYGPSGPVFATYTSGAGAALVMQSDGNLVLYAAGNRAIFQTATHGAGAQLAMQDDGNLVVYVSGHAVWSTGTVMVRAKLVAGDVLDVGGMIVSPSGRYRAIVQPDGLVVYGPSGAVWVSQRPPGWYPGSVGAPYPPQPVNDLTLNLDGFADLETSATTAFPAGSGASVGSPNIVGPYPATDDGTVSMVMQDDGNLVIYGYDQALWSSQTGAFTLAPLPPWNVTSSATSSAITLQWSAMSAALRAKVAIHGVAGVNRSYTLYTSNTLLSTVDASSGSWTDLGLAPNSAYLYLATVTDRYGRQSSASATVDTTGGSTTHTFGIDVASSGSSPALGSVSCASPSVCVAIPPPGFPRQLATGTGPAHLYNGTNWSVVSAALAPTVVSCVAGPLCVISDGSQYSTFNGTSWSTPATLGDSSAVTALSCGSATMCVATDSAGRYSVFDGTRWTVPVLPASKLLLLGLSCSSATFCVGISGSSGLLFDGHAWTVAQNLNQDVVVSRVSCRTGATSLPDCVEFGPPYSDQSAVASSAGWTALAYSQPGVYPAVSCATHCFRVTTSGVASLNGQLWSLVSPLAVAGAITDLSCPTDTFCVAVTDQGEAVRFQP